MASDPHAPDLQSEGASITSILAVPGVLAGGIWALLVIAHIAKPLGYAAFLIAFISWPILIPSSIICSVIALLVVRNERTARRRYYLIAVHIIILVVGAFTLHGMIQEIRSGGPFFSAGNG
jgi:hypothetical protein